MENNKKDVQAYRIRKKIVCLKRLVKDFASEWKYQTVWRLTAQTYTHINIQASALTYYSFFATIPILAFIIAICRGFGFEGVVFTYLTKSLSDATSVSTIQTIFNMIESYLNQAKGGMLLGIGVIFLFWSIYNVCSQIERSLNDIWGENRLRRLFPRLSYYFSLILLIPFLTIISAGVTLYFNYHIEYLADLWIVKFILFIKPWLLSWSICTLLYMVIPKPKVKLVPALIAGILAGSVVIGAKTVFFMLMRWVTGYNAVYGSLAIIPIILLFFRIVWIIVLCGAQSSFILQNYQRYKEEKKVCAAYLLCLEKFLIEKMHREDAHKVLDPVDLASKYNIPVRLLRIAMKHLSEKQLVKELSDERKVQVYVLEDTDEELLNRKLFSESSDKELMKFINDEFANMNEVWRFVGDWGVKNTKRHQ